MDNVKVHESAKYYIYTETNFAARKRSGVYIKDYHPTIDWRLPIIVMAIGCLLWALVLAGII